MCFGATSASFVHQGLQTSPPVCGWFLSQEAIESQSIESEPAGDREPIDDEDPGEMDRSISRRVGHADR